MGEHEYRQRMGLQKSQRLTMKAYMTSLGGRMKEEEKRLNLNRAKWKKWEERVKARDEKKFATESRTLNEKGEEEKDMFEAYLLKTKQNMTSREKGGENDLDSCVFAEGDSPGIPSVLLRLSSRSPSGVRGMVSKGMKGAGGASPSTREVFESASAAGREGKWKVMLLPADGKCKSPFLSKKNAMDSLGYVPSSSSEYYKKKMCYF
jgi:hypothetical protein